MHEDLFEKHYLAPLAQAEAEGRFRRLIPIGKTTRIRPMNPNKHPQWIIGKGPA
jgi:hypothetical protein